MGTVSCIALSNNSILVCNFLLEFLCKDSKALMQFSMNSTNQDKKIVDPSGMPSSYVICFFVDDN